MTDRKCPIDCRNATTPKSECNCSCEGKNHGTQPTITSFGALEDTASTLSVVDPVKHFTSVADVDGFTVDDIAEIDPQDIRVIYEDPNTGWTDESCVFETVRNGDVEVKKRDGFYTTVSPDQIPAKQFDQIKGTFSTEKGEYMKKKQDKKRKLIEQ